MTVAGPTSMPDSPQVWAEAWIQPQSPLTGTQTILTKVGSYSLKQVNQNVMFEVIGTANLVPCTTISTGNQITVGDWIHVAGWYDGLSVSLSINGVVRATTSCTNGPVASSAGPFYVGGIFTAPSTVIEPYAGRIDEVRVRMDAAQQYRPTRSVFVIPNNNSGYLEGEGFFMISRVGSPNQLYSFGVHEGNGGTTIFNQSGHFTTTNGTDGKVNLFSEGPPHRFTIQNNSGSSISLHVSLYNSAP